MIFLLQAGDGEGCCRSVADVITFMVKKDNLLLNTVGQEPIELTIKICCDGAKLGKNFSAVKTAIAIVTDRNNIPRLHRSSPDDEYLISIYKGM